MMSTLPLFIAGCEVFDWTEREYVLDRLQWVRARVGLEIIDRVIELLYEVWKRQIVHMDVYWLDVMKDIEWSLMFG